MFCVAKVFAVHFSIAMSAKRNSSRIVACKDDECVPVVFTPVKKVKSVESSLSVTPEARASYSAAMKELCESLTPEEEVVAKAHSKWATVVKVYYVSEGFPAVIMLENGYNLKEYIKGGKSGWKPLEDRCPINGMFYGEGVSKVFTNYELVMPEEWDSIGAVWLIVGDFNDASTVDHMEEILRVLSSSRVTVEELK